MAEECGRTGASDERAYGVEDADCHGADLEREDLADGEVGRAGGGGGDEEDHGPAGGLSGRGEKVGLKESAGEEKQCSAECVGEGDHLLAADRVEEMAEEDRAKDVADGEREDIVAGVRGRDAVEALEHQGVGEEDGVVEEGLRDHQGQAEEGAGAVLAGHGGPYLMERGVGAGVDFYRLFRGRW